MCSQLTVFFRVGGSAGIWSRCSIVILMTGSTCTGKPLGLMRHRARYCSIELHYEITLFHVVNVFCNRHVSDNL
jgi:hypothetical protein